MLVRRTDRITVRLDASTTIRHANGWVDAWGVATRSGVLQYPEHGTAEFRPPAEVFDAASLASLRGVPLTIDHPASLVTADDTRRLTHGWVLQVVPDPPLVRVQVRLASREVLDAVAGGILELSGGYLADFAAEDGTDPTDGTPYNGVQRRIRYNHLALVEAARAGHQARLTLDSKRRPIMRKLQIGSATYTITEALANTIGKLAASADVHAMRADKFETSTLAIDGQELVMPKAMIDALLAGLGISTSGGAMPPAEPPMEDEAPPPAAGATPPGERLDAKLAAAISAEVGRAVGEALAQHRADAAHAAAVERTATAILGQAPSSGDVYGVMVEAIARLDADRKPGAEILAARARKGDARAAGQLEGMMEALPREDAVRVDHAAELGLDIDRARREDADGGKPKAPLHRLEDARQRQRQRKLDAGKPKASA